LAAWCRKTEQGWLIAVHAQPGAKKTAAAGLHGEALKIRIAAQPLEGKANEALIAFIAKALGVPRRSVTCLKGETSREKLLLVTDAGAEPARLLPHGDGAAGR
jgi:uncharacterized protein